ncbi:anaphase promoting complex subunit 1 [Aspergillus clavatus NRRL 1]|uniref:20S cyclosome subunit (APC1/BimE), putative n=1 Tax=Aspergillus clavatus (strain ATCC 1007 / CBS 513.65 / DSM 816 / NCTC 3887 / NRRL 1 / QM 1276 / 107) TaxID=344612 RepID=A1CJ63_ASPCL|nr:20S cyclosome subunit (APC1/BimE), putative [Aspergillus clavatus NRRL 1]EAW09187.1 20S cyclosome subunit (APC1/BimE), putative [Aspergillus clavatus NRRL 1]
MACVRSLGRHEPSAVPFLVAEGLLPPDPSSDQYTWHTTIDEGPNGPVDDELVWTTSCVVWSQAGVVKRVFRVDIEREEVKHALFTNFSVSKATKPGRKTAQGLNGNAGQKHGDTEHSRGLQSQAAHEVKLPNLGRTLGANGQPVEELQTAGGSVHSSRALVVVLKSQAHIFFLAGNSHVIPLPFEVESVFATPRGLLFQRKMHEDDTNAYPMAPPNSFLSSFPTIVDLRASQSAELPSGKAKRPSLIISPAQNTRLKSRTNKQADLPRVFSLMDPHSEMGLVVTKQTSRWLQSSITSTSRLSGLDVLDPADEIVYVSPKNELLGSSRSLSKIPLILVITVNMNTGLYTIWTARYREDEAGPSSKKQQRRDTGGTRSKRRSSHFSMATGSTTPAARPSAARESFGPRGDNWNASGFSHSQYSVDSKPDDDDLAARLGQDFGDIGVPSKTSRRVSSLLARTDLATSQDRITFSDLATGSQTGPAPHTGLRQSIGAASTRASFGFNPRGSLPPGNGSVYSTTSSFVDAPVDRLLEELNNDSLFEGFENMDLKGATSGLPEEVLLSKVESFSSRFSGTFQTPVKATKPSRRVKIITLCPSECGITHNGNSAVLAVYLVDQDAKSMTVVHLRADKVTFPKKDAVVSKKPKKRASSEERSLLVQATGIHHFPNVHDACRVADGQISRVLTLGTTDSGRNELHLQSPWTNPTRIDIPEKLMLYERYGFSSTTSMLRPRESGMNRLMTDGPIVITGLDHPSIRGKFDVIDTMNQRHKLQVQMEPTNGLVKDVLRICKFVLRDFEKAGDGILAGWWETVKWLSARDSDETDIEWTALTITLFAMAVPFIECEQTLNKRARRKKALLRSSSGSHVDLESWEAMLDKESNSSGVVAPWMATSSWGWILEQDAQEDSEGKRAKDAHRPDQLGSGRSTFRKNTYLTRCIALAREFLRTPEGNLALGSDGHLPTALACNGTLRRTALCTIVAGLHLFREEQKLSVCEAEHAQKPLGLLAPVLAQIGAWLGWTSWTWADDSYYGSEMACMDQWEFEASRISMMDIPPEPFAPPSIFAHLENAWRQPSPSFFTLLDLTNTLESTSRHSKLWQECFILTPRTLALNGFLSEIHDISTSLERVKLLNRWNFTKSVIESFPEGVSGPLYEAIMRTQNCASASWSVNLLELIDREDLSMSMDTDNSSPASVPPQPALSHDAVRDFHHIGGSALDVDSINSFEASAEADRFSVTRLIFREDKRFIEAARLLNQSKAPVAECIPEPEWTDSDLLEAQKEVVQLVTLRTLSVPTGRAMLAFSGRLPLLTEKLPIPSFSLQCVMKPSNVTISAERASFSEEKVCWAFFHNGVSTGLAISKKSKGIDTSWILFNKPQELTNRHAGFLLALGLNGHLKSLAKWVAFKYLTPKHTMTSIGLLLGLSASYLGTMDTLITRLLSVHVTRMLPLGAAELNLSPLTQTAGIMGIGLLYCNSQHRRMSEVMLSEIEKAEQEESSPAHEDLRDEGYRLAAGFALGFINLAKGKDLRGMRDMHIVERLLAIAVGTKSVHLAHVLDRATAGATIALMIIFMKTNDESLAQKIDIPDTTVRFDYVRPDLFLLRTLARHVIMWDSIRPSFDWIIESLPKIYRRRYRLTGVGRLKSDDMPFFNIIAGLCFALGLRFAGSAQPAVRDLLVSYLDQFIRICRLPAMNYDGRLTRNSVRNCQDIVALSAATVMAGTGDLALFRRLRSLHGRVDSDTPYGSHLAAHMAIGLLFLGGGSYTVGTSDLAIASLIVSLYPIFPTTVLDNKCHLQAFRHLWVLAAEPRCLVPRDIDSRRPIPLPITVTGRDGGRQTVTAPCLLPDLDSIARVEIRSPDYWPLVLDFTHNTPLYHKFRHGDQSVYLRRKTTYNPGGSSVFVSTLSSLSEAQDVLPSPSSSLSATAAQGRRLLSAAPPKLVALLSSESSRAITRASPSQNPWDWIFSLQSLRGLDIQERALVLPSSFPSRPRGAGPSSRGSAAPWLRLSAVDSKLVIENSVRNVIRAARGRGADPDEVQDGLWQLRLLYSWLDHASGRVVDDAATVGDDAEGRGDEDGRLSKGLWLRRDFLEETRWKIWGVQMGGGE